MRANTVDIDVTGQAPVFTFAESFNVSVHMIDRHIQEGRGDRTAYLTGEERVTYAQLAERVNRWGNALLESGLAPGGRLLMIVKDCPEFVYLFFGAIKAGIVPIPVNTLLRAADYRYMIEDSECAALVHSPEFAAEVEPALATANRSLIDLTPGRIDPGSSVLESSSFGRDGRLFLALFLGVDRSAERHDPSSAGLAGQRRALFQSCPQHHRERHHVLGGEAVLRIWTREFDELPTRIWCGDCAFRRTPVARDDFPHYRTVSTDGVFRSAHALRGPMSSTGNQLARPLQPSPVHIGRRGLAVTPVPSLERAYRDIPWLTASVPLKQLTYSFPIPWTMPVPGLVER